MTTTSASNIDSNLIINALRAGIEQELRSRYSLTDPSMRFAPGMFPPGSTAIVFQRWADLGVLTTAMSENTTPTGQALTATVESVTAGEYGGVIEVGNRAQFLSSNKAIGVGVDKAAQQAAKTIHQLVRAALHAGTNIKYSGTATTASAVTASLTGAKFKTCVDLLRKTNVPRYDDGFYRAVLTTEQCASLMTDTATGGWVDISKYAQARQLLLDEVGTYYGCRIIDATGEGYVDTAAGATYSGGTYDVHSGIIMGPEAYGVMGLGGLETSYIPAEPSASDPLGLIAKLGWHLYPFGAALLTKAGNRYVRLKTAETTLS